MTQNKSSLYVSIIINHRSEL